MPWLLVRKFFLCKKNLLNKLHHEKVAKDFAVHPPEMAFKNVRNFMCKQDYSYKAALVSPPGLKPFIFCRKNLGRKTKANSLISFTAAKI